MKRPKLRILCISSMFPNPRMPVHAVFVKQRLDALSVHTSIQVISPIPWFPGEAILSRYRNRHKIPQESQSNHYPTFFPKFFSLPGVLKPLDGIFLALGVWWFLTRKNLQHSFDIIDCHLAYPDAMAGFFLGSLYHRPYSVTLRGHDINDLYKYHLRIAQVIFCLKHCSVYFGVANALVKGAIQLGAPADKGFPATNGVDVKRFFPIPKLEARKLLQLDAQCAYLLCVSHLVERKGIHIIIEALALLRNQAHSNLGLIIVGKGGEEGNYEPTLRKRAQDLGVSAHIIWAGAIQNQELARYYSAADLFCLASEKEGWPNVLLEAISCGTPVIAANTWGIPEIIHSKDIGLLVDERTAPAFAKAIDLGLKQDWDPKKLSAYASMHTWENTAQVILNHFHRICPLPLPIK